MGAHNHSSYRELMPFSGLSEGQGSMFWGKDQEPERLGTRLGKEKGMGMRAGGERGSLGESQKVRKRAETREFWKRTGGSRKDGRRLSWMAGWREQTGVMWR